MPAAHSRFHKALVVIRAGALTLLMLCGCARLRYADGVVCDLSAAPLDLPMLVSDPLPPPTTTDAIAESPLPPPAPPSPTPDRPRAPSSPESDQAFADHPDIPRPPAPGTGQHAYRIQPFDRLHIEVFGEADISRAYVVSAEGTIKHPLLNSVQVSGATLHEAEQNLTELLRRDYLVNPRVSIRIEKSSGRHVTMLGEVKQTGTLYISPEQRFSLLNAIAAAGGFSELAARNRVRIIRDLDGEERLIKVNCDDLLKGRGDSRDVDLEPGDVIMVPEAFF